MQRRGQAGRINCAAITLRPSQMSDPNFVRVWLKSTIGLLRDLQLGLYR